jgi:hypothetical protein
MEVKAVMPNHVINKITVTGDAEMLRDMLESIRAEDQELGSVDFNKIIPMPDSMDIESGSNTDKGLKAYTDFMFIYTLAGTRDDVDLDRIPKKSEEAFLNARPDATPAQWELGKTAYRNQSKYGAPTWYEWSIQNWGTKWNAYNSVECEPHGDTAELCFHTAWSPPQPVLQRLSEQYPELAFSHAWADEDIGFNCGIIEYKNGEIISEYLPEGNEAVSFACEQWGYNPEEYEDMTMNM